MLGKPSIVTRIAAGKMVGFLFGLAGFLSLPYLVPEAGQMLRWGVLLWYLTLGAVIGAFGVVTSWKPVLALPLPWWLRAPFVGAWMNFVLTLLLYERLLAIGETIFGPGSALASPFWFVAVGALAGLVIGYAATRAGGEGAETLER